MKYPCESDDHWRSTKRSLCWTLVLLAVMTVALASAL